MAQTGTEPRWGVWSFRTLGWTAIWCVVTAVGYVIADAAEGPKGGLRIGLVSFFFGLACLAGAVIGWFVATVLALVGVARPKARRLLDVVSLVVCLLMAVAAALMAIFWGEIFPGEPMIPQGGHGDML